MCDQTIVNYNEGDIVWVKLGPCWWPGEIVDPKKLPEDILAGLKFSPLYIVKFFQEDSYEYVKNIDQIYTYNCTRKDEFIRRGLNKYRSKITFMENFPTDICTAELKTGGDPNILDDPKFAPPKRVDYSVIFGSPKKKTPVKTKKDSDRTLQFNVTHPRFLGAQKDDFQIRYLVQTPETMPPENNYNCSVCGFTTTRIDVMVLHSKCHVDGYVLFSSKKKNKSPVKKKRKVEHKKSHSGSDNETSKPKKKQKKVESKPIVENKHAEIRSEILMEWEDSDTDEDFFSSTEKSVFEKEECTKNENKDDTLNKSDTSKESSKKDDPFCFDFLEDEDNVDSLPTTSGRKIPRVIPPSEKKKSVELDETLELTTVDNSLCKNSLSDKIEEDDTVKNAGNEALPRENLTEERFDTNLDNFENILESTAVPNLPEVPNLLKCEQNFHSARTIKFPDKYSDEVKYDAEYSTGIENKQSKNFEEGEDFFLDDDISDKNVKRGKGRGGKFTKKVDEDNSKFDSKPDTSCHNESSPSDKPGKSKRFSLRSKKSDIFSPDIHDEFFLREKESDKSNLKINTSIELDSMESELKDTKSEDSRDKEKKFENEILGDKVDEDILLSEYKSEERSLRGRKPLERSIKRQKSVEKSLQGQKSEEKMDIRTSEAEEFEETQVNKSEKVSLQVHGNSSLQKTELISSQKTEETYKSKQTKFDFETEEVTPRRLLRSRRSNNLSEKLSVSDDKSKNDSLESSCVESESKPKIINDSDGSKRLEEKIEKSGRKSRRGRHSRKSEITDLNQSTNSDLKPMSQLSNLSDDGKDFDLCVGTNKTFTNQSADLKKTHNEDSKQKLDINQKNANLCNKDASKARTNQKLTKDLKEKQDLNKIFSFEHWQRTVEKLNEKLSDIGDSADNENLKIDNLDQKKETEESSSHSKQETSKIINPKKRFVKSFENYEQMLNERRRSERTHKAQGDNSKTSSEISKTSVDSSKTLIDKKFEDFESSETNKYLDIESSNLTTSSKLYVSKLKTQLMNKLNQNNESSASEADLSQNEEDGLDFTKKRGRKSKNFNKWSELFESSEQETVKIRRSTRGKTNLDESSGSKIIKKDDQEKSLEKSNSVVGKALNVEETTAAKNSLLEEISHSENTSVLEKNSSSNTTSFLDKASYFSKENKLGSEIANYTMLVEDSTTKSSNIDDDYENINMSIENTKIEDWEPGDGKIEPLDKANKNLEKSKATDHDDTLHLKETEITGGQLNYAAAKEILTGRNRQIRKDEMSFDYEVSIESATSIREEKRTETQDDKDILADSSNDKIGGKPKVDANSEVNKKLKGSKKIEKASSTSPKKENILDIKKKVLVDTKKQTILNFKNQSLFKSNNPDQISFDANQISFDFNEDSIDPSQVTIDPDISVRPQSSAVEHDQSSMSPCPLLVEPNQVLIDSYISGDSNQASNSSTQASVDVIQKSIYPSQTSTESNKIPINSCQISKDSVSTMLSLEEFSKDLCQEPLNTNQSSNNNSNTKLQQNLKLEKTTNIQDILKHQKPFDQNARTSQALKSKQISKLDQTLKSNQNLKSNKISEANQTLELEKMQDTNKMLKEPANLQESNQAIQDVSFQESDLILQDSVSLQESKKLLKDSDQTFDNNKILQDSNQTQEDSKQSLPVTTQNPLDSDENHLISTKTSQDTEKNSIESQMAKLTDTILDMSPLPPHSSTKTSSSKLLDILTEGKTQSSQKQQNTISQKVEIKTSEPTIIRQGPAFDPKSQRFIIKSSSVTTTGNRTGKATILSDKLIKSTVDNGSIAVQKMPAKRSFNDIEDIDTYIIQKPTKKAAVGQNEKEESGFNATSKQSTKISTSAQKGKPHIIQQTIITPSGNIIQPPINQTTQQTEVTTADDFDINSMPIVISDQILTAESLENMPLVFSDSSPSTTAKTNVVIKKPHSPTKKAIISQIKLGGKQSPIYMGKEQTFVIKEQVKSSPMMQRVNTVSQKITPAKGTTTLLQRSGGTLVQKGGTVVQKGGTLIQKGGIIVQGNTLIQGSTTVQGGNVQSGNLAQKSSNIVQKGSPIIQKGTTLLQKTLQKASIGQKITLGSASNVELKGSESGTPKMSASKTTPAIIRSTGGQKQVKRVYEASSKFLKTNPTIMTTPGKPGKFVVIPPTSSTPTGSKYTVGKRTTVVKGSTPVSEVSGNKIMIVTNNQGQQSKVILTPAQQKLLYQQQGTKIIKSTIKTPIQKNISTPIAGTSSKSPNIVSQTIITSKGQVMTTNQNVQQQQFKVRIDPKTGKKTPISTQKVYTKVGMQQKDALLQKMARDALLEQQVAEQLQAINKASEKQMITKPQQIKPETSTKFPLKKSYVKKQNPLVEKQKAQVNTQVPSLAPLSPAKKIEIKTEEVKSEPQKQPQCYVIQDAQGNQTTITEGQILAIPSETVDGQPQSYMLVTVDETGNLKPLNNETLMTLDPNLNLGGDLNNMVLQIEQGQENEAGTSKVAAAPVEKMLPVSSKVEAPVEVVQEKPKEVSVESGNVQSFACNITTNDTNQQLIITGDPVVTQKLLESLTEGNTDLANLLANADGNILIQADGQQILINTANNDNQMLLTGGVSENDSNPVFGGQGKNTDILAAALAGTDVFQQESILPAQNKIPAAQLSPNSTMYPITVGNVLETSSMSSPIMTPLEVPSSNSKKIDDESEILSQVPKNVDLPITITDPNISQTVAQQQVASMIVNELQSNLELPLSIQDPGIGIQHSDMNSPSYINVPVTLSGDITQTSDMNAPFVALSVAPSTEIVPTSDMNSPSYMGLSVSVSGDIAVTSDMNSPSYNYTLPSLDETVDLNQKAFTTSISMPLLTEAPEDILSENPEGEKISPEDNSERKILSMPSVMEIEIANEAKTTDIDSKKSENVEASEVDVSHVMLLPANKELTNENVQQKITSNDNIEKGETLTKIDEESLVNQKQNISHEKKFESNGDEMKDGKGDSLMKVDDSNVCPSSENEIFFPSKESSKNEDVTLDIANEEKNNLTECDAILTERNEEMNFGITENTESNEKNKLSFAEDNTSFTESSTTFIDINLPFKESTSQLSENTLPCTETNLPFTETTLESNLSFTDNNSSIIEDNDSFSENITAPSVSKNADVAEDILKLRETTTDVTDNITNVQKDTVVESQTLYDNKHPFTSSESVLESCINISPTEKLLAEDNANFTESNVQNIENTSSFTKSKVTFPEELTEDNVLFSEENECFTNRNAPLAQNNTFFTENTPLIDTSSTEENTTEQCSVISKENENDTTILKEITKDSMCVIKTEEMKISSDNYVISSELHITENIEISPSNTQEEQINLQGQQLNTESEQSEKLLLLKSKNQDTLSEKPITTKENTLQAHFPEQAEEPKFSLDLQSNKSYFEESEDVKYMKAVSEGLCTIRGGICNSLSEPPPDMFDFQTYEPSMSTGVSTQPINFKTSKGESFSALKEKRFDEDYRPNVCTEWNLNSPNNMDENSCEIPVQPQIVTDLNSDTFEGDENSGIKRKYGDDDQIEKRCKFD